MKKKNNRLVVSLSKYYITFVFILVAIFVISYFILGYTLSKSIKNNSIPIYNIINGSIDDIDKINYEDIKKLGGYVEILDSNRNVIKTIGNSYYNKSHYTENELLQTISVNNKDEKYNVLVNMSKNNNEDVTVLIWVPKSKFSYEFNFFKVPYSIGKYYYKTYVKVVGSAVLVGIINIIIYSAWTTKKINKPLKKIDKALVNIIQGDYNEKLNLNDAVEFVVISDTINFLIDKLKHSTEENKKLTESKSRMLMDLSHDIKTPITTIRGFSAALYSGLVNDQEQIERYYKTIYNKSERVGELVDDLFDFVKFENNSYELNLEFIDISELLRQIIVNFIDELEEREFNLDINIPSEPVMINLDSKMFKRVINNLIENAIKYNYNGTKLRIELRDIGRFIVIEVADNGVGISDDLRDSIFEAFVRGDESRSSDGGSGLGLAIADKIIKSHNGEIKLLPPTDKEKTIFYIKLYR